MTDEGTYKWTDVTDKDGVMYASSVTVAGERLEVYYRGGCLGEVHVYGRGAPFSIYATSLAHLKRRALTACRDGAANFAKACDAAFTALNMDGSRQ